MRLPATTILWAAGTALAHQNKDREPSSGTSPANDAGVNSPNVLASGGGGSSIRCSPLGISEGANLVFVLTPLFPSIQFTCAWLPDAKFIIVQEARLRRYANPTPTMLLTSALSTPTTSGSPASGGVPAGPGGAGGGNGNGGNSKFGSSNVKFQASPTGMLNVAGGAQAVERRQGDPPLQVLPKGANQVTIMVNNAANVASATHAMYLELVWETSADATSNIRTSYSQLFGIVNSTVKAEELVKLVPFPGIQAVSISGSEFSDQRGNVLESDAPKPSSSGSSGDMGSAPVPSTGSEAAPSSSGLPQGAIIGIAVAGAIVGLALIGFLVFWLLRRRRRQHGDHVSAARHRRDQHTATVDLMGEKEAAAGGMGESPHSPYSDDGHGSLPHGMASPSAAAAPASAGAGAGAGAAIAHHGSSPAPASADLHRSSFTPYSDDGTAIAPAHADADRGTDARSETPGGGRYEHLMEQGMSAEERARVMEEERQLDAEIERARK